MKTKYLLLCALFAALTAVGSLLKIPIGPILVFTMQTFFVFLSGLLLKPKYAMISQIVYMAIGLIGIPIFSTGGGISYILSPTFGYVIGFIVCAFFISLFVRKNLILISNNNANKNRALLIIKIAIFSFISVVILYVFGILYMFIIKNLYLGEQVGIWPIIVNTTIFMLLDIGKFIIALILGAAVLRSMPKAMIE